MWFVGSSLSWLPSSGRRFPTRLEQPEVPSRPRPRKPGGPPPGPYPLQLLHFRSGLPLPPPRHPVSRAFSESMAPTTSGWTPPTSTLPMTSGNDYVIWPIDLKIRHIQKYRLLFNDSIFNAYLFVTPIDSLCIIYNNVWHFFHSSYKTLYNLKKWFEILWHLKYTKNVSLKLNSSNFDRGQTRIISTAKVRT